ncbi:hypothetical protein PMAYCL1PPCAC_07602 [Pristionchus mayeri]|uniref:HIG1 domain-containing protein n=1 Tax=Pristionchus mayeri TaxID=1317129 RepID=A0AAN4ZGD3_9BILA|nr:hypothetical protein PMAYCL1PPCAC_07602 [Pristionchus mayeri]
MGFFRRVFMSTTQSQSVHDERLKHGGVPAIPTDIGYKSGKETKGAKENGVLSQAVSNPGVVLGLGLTTAALLGMLRKSFIGDKAGAQKMMQYRIMAQFFTITALVAGVTVFGTVYESKEEREKREDAERIAALALKH